MEREHFSLILTFDLIDLSVWTLCLGLLVWIQLKVYDNFDKEYISIIYSFYIIDSMEPIYLVEISTLYNSYLISHDDGVRVFH
jgi:hypothetical protein